VHVSIGKAVGFSISLLVIIRHVRVILIPALAPWERRSASLLHPQWRRVVLGTRSIVRRQAHEFIVELVADSGTTETPLKTLSG
jgi:hypothetical protein